MDLVIILSAAAVSIGVIGALWGIAGTRPQSSRQARANFDMRASDLRQGARTRAISPLRIPRAGSCSKRSAVVGFNQGSGPNFDW